MNQRLLSWIILIALMFTWGSSFILIKKGLLYFSVMEVGALRVVITFLSLAPIALPRLFRTSKRDLMYLGISGLAGSLIPAFLFAMAQTGIDSATAGMLNSLTPLSTLIIGYMIFGLKAGPVNITGVFVALAGTIGLLQFSGGNEFSFNIKYASYIIAATILYAYNVNLIKAKLKHIPAVSITAITFFIAGIPAGVILFGFTDFTTQLFREPEALHGLGYIAILAVVGTGLAMIAFNKLIKMSSPLFASSVTYMIPIVALLWGIADNEHFHPSLILWMLLIIGGVVLVNLKVRSRQASKKEHYSGRFML